MPDISELLITLVYVSSATELFSKGQLIALLNQSALHNTQHGITGLLLYKDGNIIQALEGPDKEVDALFARIKRDPRHKSVSLILRKPISERRFPTWSMAFRDLNSKDLQSLAGYSDFLNSAFTERPNPSQTELLLDLFKRSM
jgi:hypothetical protein